jgi:hypothetical protein
MRKKESDMALCNIRHDTQHNDTQHNDTQHNDTQHNDTQHNDIQHDGLSATLSKNNTQRKRHSA